MSMKHTPGPWEYSGGGIWGVSPFNARVRLADITFHNSINRIDSEANGRLMAAAPDLLAAAIRAKELLKPEVTKEPDRTIFWELAAAIAKAGGE